MPVIWCKTWYRSNSYCDHKSCLNRDVSIVPLLNWKKIESHFETWSSDAQRINLTFVAYSFVAKFVRYISAKYFLNWFPFHTVIMKVLGVNVFLKHSVFRLAVDPRFNIAKLICKGFISLISVNDSEWGREDIDTYFIVLCLVFLQIKWWWWLIAYVRSGIIRSFVMNRPRYSQSYSI